VVNLGIFIGLNVKKRINEEFDTGVTLFGIGMKN
jgi:hypothetical protein